MGSPKVRGTVSWILVVILGGLYGVAGVGKFGGGAAEMFAGWGYAPWFAILIGVLELVGAIGLLIPKTTRLAVYGLTVIMLGAVYTHVTNGEAAAVSRPLAFGVLLWVVWWLRGTSKGGTPSDL